MDGPDRAKRRPRDRVRRVRHSPEELIPTLLSAAGNQAVGSLIVQRDDRDVMIDKYSRELANGAWDAAAITLGGFNNPDIDRMLREKTQPFQLANLRAAASRLWGSGDARLLAAIDKLVAARAPKRGEEVKAFKTLFAACVAAGDYEQATTVLKNVNDADPAAARAAVKAVKLADGKPDVTRLSLLKTRAIAALGPAAGFVSVLVDPILGTAAAGKAATEGNIANVIATRDWAKLVSLVPSMSVADRQLAAYRVRRTAMPAAVAGIAATNPGGPVVIPEFSNANDGKVADPATLFAQAQVWPIEQFIAAFEHRWAADVEGIWGRESLRKVWSQLDRLPPEHVKPGMAVTLLTGVEGRVSSESTHTVEVAQGAPIEGAVRHEVGHALHENNPGVVDGWLGKMGFKEQGEGINGVLALIKALGGFPKTYVDAAGKRRPFGEGERHTIEVMLQNHTGTTSTFKAGAELPKTTGTSLVNLLWAAMPAAVRQCFQLSADSWYMHFTEFPEGTGGAWFWNHYYGKAYSMSRKVRSVVGASGDPYGAMSDKEFFAVCYENYFKSATSTGPPVYGGTMPPDVAKFLADNFLPPTPSSPKKNKANIK